MSAGASEEPRPPRRSDATRAAILRAARERFAADGYERATIRAIAAEAGIDPSMVMRYYGSKDALFAAAAEFDLRLPDLAALPRERLGQLLAAHFLDRWEGDETMVALLRAAVTQPAASERLQRVFASQMLPALARLAEARAAAGEPDPVPTHQRAAMLATQALGLALTRYVLRLPAVAALAPEEVAAWVGPTFHRYLLGAPEPPA